MTPLNKPLFAYESGKMSHQDEVLEQLRSIIDPDLGKDIVSLGFVKDLSLDDGKVSFALELTTPACPVKDQFRSQCQERLSQLDWVESVDVRMTASSRRGTGLDQAGEGLAEIGSIVAVSSCKGGVGKSTVAVNLAFALSQSGAKVGIFDADVYGPSLPTMVKCEVAGLRQEDDMIVPIEHQGLKLMSFAYATAPQGGGPAIMRGPMVTSVINQLVTGTRWGQLDYLVIDMPPGTGDVQITLAQIIPITAAIIVTTPQQISFMDVEKGIQTFDKLNIPTIGVVENMARFVCDGCGKEHRIFGHGAKARLVNQFGIKNSFELPLIPEISALSDAGTPIVQQLPDSPAASMYHEIADAVVRELSKMAYGADAPGIAFDPDEGVVVSWPDGRRQAIEAAALRGACFCAQCVDEFSGERQLQPEDVAPDIAADSIRPLGNYAATINWSDGHVSIYPYEALAAL